MIYRYVNFYFCLGDVLAQSSAFLTHPINAVGFAGQNITLNCSYETTHPDERLVWQMKREPDLDLIWISLDGVVVTNSTSIDPEKYAHEEGYDLTILELDESDANSYGCYLFMENPSVVFSWLLILGKFAETLNCVQFFGLNIINVC